MAHSSGASQSLAAGLCVIAAVLVASARAEEYDRAAMLDAAVATITPEELREHVGLLADDTLEGREAGKRGGKSAARYLENLLKVAGVEPAGDSGGYLQRFNPSYQNVLAIVPGVDPGGCSSDPLRGRGRMR